MPVSPGLILAGSAARLPVVLVPPAENPHYGGQLLVCDREHDSYHRCLSVDTVYRHLPRILRNAFEKHEWQLPLCVESSL